MNIFGKSQLVHHIKICLPVPVDKYIQKYLEFNIV